MHGSAFQQFQQDKLRLGHTDQILPHESDGWKAFQQAHSRGRMKKLLRRSRPLMDLSHVRLAGSRYEAGVATIPLSKIRGSEGRVNDFDSEFHPLNRHSAERWVSIYQAHDEGKSLPPIEVVRVGEVCYVRDGHHRVSVAKAIGQTHIEATINVYTVQK